MIQRNEKRMETGSVRGKTNRLFTDSFQCNFIDDKIYMGGKDDFKDFCLSKWTDRIIIY